MLENVFSYLEPSGKCMYHLFKQSQTAFCMRVLMVIQKKILTDLPSGSTFYTCSDWKSFPCCLSKHLQQTNAVFEFYLQSTFLKEPKDWHALFAKFLKLSLEYEATPSSFTLYSPHCSDSMLNSLCS